MMNKLNDEALKNVTGGLAGNVRARHRDGIVIEHSGYQLHIITDILPDTVCRS